MDEPLSNLDAKLRVQMRTEVSRIQQRLGTTTVYVTHDQTEAMTLGDRVAVMRSGVLQQVGTPAGALRAPGQPVRRRLHRLAGDELHAGTARGRHRSAADRRRAAPRRAAPARSSGDGEARPDRRHPPRGLRGRRAGRRRSATAASPSTRQIDVLESMGSELYAYFSRRGPGAAQLAGAAGAGRGRRHRRRPGAASAGQVVARLDAGQQGRPRARRPSCGSTPSRSTCSTPSTRSAPGAADARRAVAITSSLHSCVRSSR